MNKLELYWPLISTAAIKMINLGPVSVDKDRTLSADLWNGRNKTGTDIRHNITLSVMPVGPDMMGGADLVSAGCVKIRKSGESNWTTLDSSGKYVVGSMSQNQKITLQVKVLVPSNTGISGIVRFWMVETGAGINSIPDMMGGFNLSYPDGEETFYTGDEGICLGNGIMGGVLDEQENISYTGLKILFSGYIMNLGEVARRIAAGWSI